MSPAVPNNPSEGISLPSATQVQPQKRRRHREQAIIRRLETDDAYLEWAVLSLYERQTPGERKARTSVVRNGAGFSKPDALTFAGSAEMLHRGGHLSTEQLRTCRAPMRNGTPRIAKYRGQLVEIEDERLEDSGRGPFRDSDDSAENEVVQ